MLDSVSWDLQLSQVEGLWVGGDGFLPPLPSSSSSLWVVKKYWWGVEGPVWWKPVLQWRKWVGKKPNACRIRGIRSTPVVLGYWNGSVGSWPVFNPVKVIHCLIAWMDLWRFEWVCFLVYSSVLGSLQCWVLLVLDCSVMTFYQEWTCALGKITQNTIRY